MKKLWTLVLLSLALAAADVAAQEAALAPGARVRVTQATSPSSSAGVQRGATLVGTLESIDSTSLTVLVNGQSLVYPRDIIARLDVSAGRVDAAESGWRSTKHGAQMGAAATALVLGVSLFLAEPKTEAGVEPENIPGIAIAGVFAAGTLMGGLLGAAVGSVARDEWVPVWPRPTPVSLSVDPAPSGGTSVGLSVRF